MNSSKILFLLTLTILPLHATRELRWDWTTIDPTQIWFPPHFYWGTSDSALQTEGVVTANNTTISNSWTDFEIKQSTSGLGQERVGVACERWTRYKEDIHLMKECGMNMHRFSIEWSKIEPEENVFDEDALQHYVDMVDELLDNGIIPMITLFHHTYPLWFARKNGFELEENSYAFKEYALKVFNRLHDKVPYWIIFNEPVGFALEGYHTGNYPPGKKSLRLAGKVALNQLNAHVMVAKEFKRVDNTVKIGLSHIFNPLDAYHKWNPFELVAAKAFDHVVNDLTIKFFKTGKFNWLYLKRHRNIQAPGSLDFIGINYYTHTMIKQTGLFKMEPSNRPDEVILDKPSKGRACKVLYPEGLYRSIVYAAQLGIPIVITENGASTENVELREEYIKKHLFVISKALAEGYPIHGYLFWTFTDCYGWAKGYTNKHGIYAVDFKTQERTLRPSAHYLIDTIKKFSSYK